MKYCGIIALIVSIILLSCSSRQESKPFTCKSRGTKVGYTLNTEVECVMEYARHALGPGVLPPYTSFFQTLKLAETSIRKKLVGAQAGDACVDAIIEQIYGQWAIAFDADQDNIYGLMPYTVVAQKKGSCLGVSLLMLMLAERVGCPLKGVLLPGHFYVRYERDTVARNIEPNRQGYRHPDSYYRTRYEVAESSWYNMRILSTSEVIGVFYYNLGNILRLKNKQKHAAECYRKSVSHFKSYAEAWGNLAITMESLGKSDSARKAFSRAYGLRPALPNLAANMGTFELKYKNFSAARDAFREGIKHFPDKPVNYYGLALAFYGLGLNDSVAAKAATLSTRFPEYSKYRQLQELISTKK
jgi:tetratricopeptide (TPR) repeat protein